MPHVYLYLSDRFRNWRPEFPKQPQVVLDGIAEAIGEDQKMVELLLSSDRPLSMNPLDIEFKIEVDTLKKGSGETILRMTAKGIYSRLRGLGDIPSDATLGIWLRSKECGVFVSDESADGS